MTNELSKNKSIQASLQKLRNMGFHASTIEFNENWIGVAITSESIINYIIRNIEKYITYPQHFVEYDPQTRILIVHFWKGDMPWQLRMKIQNKQS